MEISKINQMLQSHFNKMQEGSERLFMTNVDKDKIWELYLASFEPKYNKIYRERRGHDCVSCKQFIRKFGKVVSIKNNELHTIWDVEIESEEYSDVFKALSEYVKSQPVVGVFLINEKFTNKSDSNGFRVVGTPFNFEQLDDGGVKKWEHYTLDIPTKFVHSGRDTVGTVTSNLNAIRGVFKRSLDELTIDSIETVLELIYSNTLYKGEEWKSQLELFLAHKKEYSKLSCEEKELYAWEQSVKVGSVIGKIRNHSIGTLLVDISGRVKEDGEVVSPIDLDTAVRKYEAMVAPHNYKRPKAIFTKKMLEDAKNTIEELGYSESLARRHAKLDDITVNNILFSNKDSAKKMSGLNNLDIFEDMAKSITNDVKKFSKVEEVSIDKFVEDILPHAKEVELFLENRHSNNMVSLIAPENKDCKNMFKWGNRFSWSYSGNITDSSLKDNVKSAGGSVTGDLRFSIQWNEEGLDVTDLDAHCQEPNGGAHICFSHRRSVRTNGVLDVDIQRPHGTAVENITWDTRNTMIDGVYRFYVNDYSRRGTNRGFRAEIEFDGNIYSFDCPPFSRGGANIKVAEVELRNGNFTIKEILESTTSTKEIWGISSQQFVPVSVVMNSPNYWDEQKGIGHKHVFFMLKDCINDESPNGFYNEFLKQELSKHKRVFEALGSKMRVEKDLDQLSGVGFSTTKRESVVVRVTGNTQRIMKVKF